MSRPLRAALGAGLAALALAGSAGAGGDDGLAGSRSLAPVLHALQAANTSHRERPIHIIQIGDSHTANDYIAGALRDQLQFRFGHGGRGVLPPGLPYRGFDPRLVQVAQTGDWRVALSFAPTPSPAHPEQPRLYAAPPPFGLTGYRLTASGKASMTLDAESGAGFSRAVVCALATPGAGAITLSAGAAQARYALAAATPHAVCHSLATTAPQHQLRLESDGAGPVTLLSWATFASGGVALSNLGVSGTQLKDFATRDDAVMAAEFDAYKPDLIILAYGTNEGYAANVDPAAYETLLRAQLRRLKRLSHGAPILVLGAPDAEALRPDLYNTGGTFSCAPLSDDEQRNLPALVAQRSPRLARWYPPSGLAAIRGAQRRAVQAEDDAYWDWSARMGGPCSAHRMSQSDPRLVRGDHIHYTAEGGVKIAGLLFDDLMRAR